MAMRGGPRRWAATPNPNSFITQASSVSPQTTSWCALLFFGVWGGVARRRPDGDRWRKWRKDVRGGFSRRRSRWTRWKADGAPIVVLGSPVARRRRFFSVLGDQIAIVYSKLCTQPQANKQTRKPRTYVATGGGGSAHNRAVGWGWGVQSGQL